MNELEEDDMPAALGRSSEFQTCDPEVSPESPGEDSGAASAPLESLPTQNDDSPFSDSLRAAVSPTAPLFTLGPELFEVATKELLRTRESRGEAERSGMIFIFGYGQPPLFKDERSRAHYIYKCIMGMTWPNSLSEMEKRRLNLKFAEGWDSGDLVFLAGVPWDEIDVYREGLAPTDSM